MNKMLTAGEHRPAGLIE